jgi:hypothetical protein
MGLRTVPVSWVFSQAFQSVTDDFTIENENGIISGVQTVFIDAGQSPAPFTLTFLETGQIIYIEPYSQGYYAVLCHQAINYTLSSYGWPSGGSNTIAINLQFINVEISPSIWFSQNTYAINAVSSNAGNATLTATIAGTSAALGGLIRTPFITVFDITGTGATAAGSVNATLPGLFSNEIGSTIAGTWVVNVPAISSGLGVYLSVRFAQPLQTVTGSSAVLTVPAMGAGQTAAAVILYGFRK